MDAHGRRERGLGAPFFYALSGVILTMVGAFTHPVILGLGNALFHVGGGVGTLEEDSGHGWKGRALGIFVAPGAFGIFAGKECAFAWEEFAQPLVALATLVSVVLLASQALVLSGKCGQKYARRYYNSQPEQPLFTKRRVAILCFCFALVVLRSHLGMSMQFAWKTSFTTALAAVLVVVFGKAAGGFLAARIGMRRALIYTLAASAICLLIGQHMFPGLMGLLLLNMTMPMTLYLLAREFKALPGCMFGILTFALFVGFLPTYFTNGRGLSSLGMHLSDKNEAAWEQGYRIFVTFAVSLVLTLLIELSVALVWRIRKDKALLMVVLVNVLTNPIVVFANYCGTRFVSGWNTLYQLPIEVLAVLVEAGIYVLFSHKGKEFIKHPIWLAVSANAISYGCGLLINMLN